MHDMLVLMTLNLTTFVSHVLLVSFVCVCGAGVLSVLSDV